MNDKKIAFIYCVNNRALYEESVRYVKSLHVPEGYEVEFIAIEGASSITSGYNQGMRQTDAKYKVYLHQDVFIVNKNFLYDIITLFEKYPKLGMIGVVGAKTIPRNGVWWESTQRFGKVYDSHTGEMKLLSFKDTELDYEPVQAIDGLIMITQYDILWREDLFTGWYFYDLSQCQEFLLAGYDVGVVRQKEPWCIHDCGIRNLRNGVDNDKRIFNQVYGQNVSNLNKKHLPLVSILIPTYNRPHYFELALQSALNQTYENIEIIVCDDSTSDETEKLIKKYTSKYDNLTYIKNPTRLGQFENDIKLFNLANGEYINYLMDDDLFHPQKIEKMMNYFIQDLNEEISLVTSHRAIIDDKGNNQGLFGNTDHIFKKDTIIDGIELGNFILKNNYNCVGEPTTVLFRKSKLEEPFGVFNGRKYGCNVDQATWFQLLSKGKAVFIAEVLSYFRIHDDQQLGSSKMKLLGAIDYAHEVLTVPNYGYLTNVSEYKKALVNCLSYCERIIHDCEMLKETELGTEYKELEEYHRKLKDEIADFNRNLKNNSNLPLVSILIPAYNQTKYLKEALESAINQTYPNIEIIIGDDSTTDEVENFIKPYLNKYKQIRYFKNNRKTMDNGYSNHVNCFNLSKGEYINYLNHDDIFHPEKIERMMNVFMQNPNLTLVTSVRQPIDEKGKYLPLSGGGFTKLTDKDTLFSGYELSRIVIKNLVNIIGEPTTVLFKKKYIEKFGFFNGVRFHNIADVATWFTLLQYGDAAYLSEPLSYFRKHPDQNSSKADEHIKGVIAWYQLIKHSFKTGIIQNINEYKETLNKWLTTFISILNGINSFGTSLDNELREKLANCYKEAIDEVIYKKAEEKM